MVVCGQHNGCAIIYTAAGLNMLADRPATITENKLMTCFLIRMDEENRAYRWSLAIQNVLMVLKK